MTINPDILKTCRRRLSEVLGPGHVITDPDILESYAHDETSDLKARPDILVRPETAKHVAGALEICGRHHVPVTPRGAGTGVTGGALPVHGGVVLSLEKLNKIIEIDTRNMIAVVEPGVITATIQQEAAACGLMYPPDPASLDTCSIGGNVAENAGGPRAVKYGTTKDYVLGLEFVLADGTIMKSGGKIVKNATGYNLIGILLGSEGTLAVITKIFLRLVPEPAVTRDLMIPFSSLENAIDAVDAILQHKIIPATIEFMEEDAIKLVARHARTPIPYAQAGAHLLVQIDGGSDDQVFNDLVRISELIAVDAKDIIVAESSTQRQRIWAARRAIRESISAESPVFLAEDCVVPRAVIPAFLKGLKHYLSGKKLHSVMFGHAGDGNVHIDILKDDIDYEQWQGMLPDIKAEIYRRALSLGGAITGEHGIGCLRKQYLGMALSPEEIQLMKRIKVAFDPGMILNPGKIFT